MSWLSKIVSKTFSSPNNALKMAFNPASGSLDAIKSGNAPTPATTATTINSPSQGNGYFGDTNDPNYGSFTKPFDVQSFYQNLDPSYFFRLEQGQQGLVNSAAAGSGSMSGSAMKDLINYNQDAASQEYGNAYNRYQTTQGNIFSRLSQMAGLGQASAAGVGANGVALAGQAGQALQNSGSASGAGIVGDGNAINSGLNTYGAANYMKQWGGATGGAPSAVSTPAFGSTNINYSNAASPSVGSMFVSP